MPHTDINSREEFEAAIATTGKYVLIYAYEGTVDPEADAKADEHASTVAAYKVDMAKNPEAKEKLAFTKTPTILLFKDGKELVKAEGKDDPKGAEIKKLLSS